MQEGDVVTATFTIEVPGVPGTKAATSDDQEMVGDGRAADNLVFAVFDETGAELPDLRQGDWVNPIGDNRDVIKFDNSEQPKVTVTVKLVRGKEYSFVCWAQNEAATCYNFEDMKNIGISYADYNASNNDLRDAFYAYAQTDGPVTENFSQTIELERPFAQINVGTTDFVAAQKAGLEIENLYSTMTVKNAATSLETFTGKTSGSQTVTFTYAHAIAPDYDLVINKNKVVNNPNIEIADKYGWLAMNYILVADGTDKGTSSALAEVSFQIREGDATILASYDVPNVPVQRNFRSNIVGGLLTAEGTINVIIDPIFNGEYVINVWDGYTVEEPASNAEATEYYITKASELAWVAKQVNEAGNTFEGVTVYLTSDIDLAGQVWTPIGAGETPFMGTLEATHSVSKLTKAASEYCTIYGLVVDYKAGPAGLVGWLKGGAVKNIVLDQPEVNGKACVAAVVGKVFNSGLVDGCKVIGGEINGNHWVGGIAGHAYATITNNVIDGTSVKGVSIDEDNDGDKVGGLVGLHPADATSEVSGNQVLAVTVAAKRDVAALVGAGNGDNVKNNHVETAAITATVADNAGVVVGRVLAGIVDYDTNTYGFEEGKNKVTINGTEVEPAEYEFVVTPSEENVEVIPTEGGEFVLNVTGNVDWTVTAEGVEVDPQSGKGNGTITVTVPETTVTSTEVEGNVKFTVTVSTEKNAEQTEYTFTIEQTPAEPAFEDGEYWIVANGKYAMPLTTSYGYVQVDPYGFLDNVFTVKAVSGGYTIQDANGYYYYQTGTYDSFNRSTTQPSSGAVWTISMNEDGSCKIVNNAVNKFIQYDAQYNSFGSYAEEKGVMPAFVKVENARERMEPSNWGVVGVNGDWDNDITMFIKDNYFVAYDVEIKSGAFKFRQDKGWDVNYGGESKVNTAVMTVAGGADIEVPAGIYDLYLDPAAHAYWVMTAGQIPSAPDFKVINVYASTTYTNLYAWTSKGTITSSWPGTAYAGQEEIAGTTFKKWSIVVDNSTFASTAQFIFNNGSSQTADSAPYQLAEEMFFTVSGTSAATLTERPVEVPVGGGSADFATIKSTNTSYVNGKTTAGWIYSNCAIFQGGTSDSSPKFKMIGDESNRALCMNGKTTAQGVITSPILTGGCGTLTFNYGLPFSDTNMKFSVDIIQDDVVVKTFTVNNASATKLTKYSFEEEVNVSGDFQIKLTNLSPSNNTGNKDRTAIWDLVWTGCAK